jgi:hypothetical protein
VFQIAKHNNEVPTVLYGIVDKSALSADETALETLSGWPS